MSVSDREVKALVEQTVTAYEQKFGGRPEVAAVAPGRVEVLGNHTDYNGGYVLSAAIDMRTCIAAGKQSAGKLTMLGIDMNEVAEASLSEIRKDDRHKWASYPLGVIDQIKKLDAGAQLGGATLAIHSQVPIGSGLSSSAALEVSTSLAVQALYPYEIEEMALAQLCQRAENQFVGVSSGLMDQFSSVFGKRDHLLFLDCLTLQHEALPLGDHPVSFVVTNTMVEHALVGGEYNSRRAECESAAKKLGRKMLRDVTLDMLGSGKDKLSENEYKRAKHVVTEDERVLKARDAVRSGDVQTLGRLMSESHESSRTLFENSTPELDRLSEIARNLPGCYGARLMGGGFGGTVVALVDAPQVEAFSTKVSESYGNTIGKKPDVYVCKIAQGAERVAVR